MRHTPGHDVCVFWAGSANSGPGGDLGRARDVPRGRVKGSTLLYIFPTLSRSVAFSGRAVERSQKGPRALGTAKIDTKILPRAVVISKITDGGLADLSESRRIFCQVICCS